jgi:hypothetical protein
MSNEFEVRSFTDKGLEVAKQFLDELRECKTQVTIEQILSDETLVIKPYPGITIEQRQFSNRRRAANYFHERFALIPADKVRREAGLWTWLTFVYFDQVCPVTDGQRKVRNDYTYIFMPGSSMYFYRHLLFIAWYALHIAPEHNRLCLDTSLHSLDKATVEILKRLYLTRIPSIFEVLDRLYWDTTRKRPRKGIVSPGKPAPGDLVHRLPTRIRQLEKTYDLQSLSADQLLELLGDEFCQYLTKQPTMFT